MSIYYDYDPSVEVHINEALPVWAEAARPFLKGLASTFGAYTTYKMLALYLFEETGLRTNRPLQRWPGEVLGMVLDYCTLHGLPALSSLVVNQETGTCGGGFGVWHQKVGIEPVTDAEREDLAAVLRVECYRHYALDVPEGVEKFHTPIYLQWRDQQR